MNPKQILEAAKAKIQDPKHWTQNAFARDVNDDAVEITAPVAIKFCATGALIAIEASTNSSTNEITNAAVLLRVAANTLFNSTVLRINDGLDHKAVMAIFDEAIEKSDLL